MRKVESRSGGGYDWARKEHVRGECERGGVRDGCGHEWRHQSGSGSDRGSMC